MSAFKHLFPSLHTCFYLSCFPLSFPLLTEAVLILTSLIVNSGATSFLHALVTGDLIQGLSFFVNTCGACRINKALQPSLSYVQVQFKTFSMIPVSRYTWNILRKHILNKWRMWGRKTFILQSHL